MSTRNRSLHLRDYLHQQNLKLKNYSFVDGSLFSCGHSRFSQHNAAQEVTMKRNFIIPLMKDLFKDQEADRLKHVNGIIIKQLNGRVKHLSQFANRFKVQDATAKGRKSRKGQVSEEQARTRWIVSIHKNIEADKRQMQFQQEFISDSNHEFSPSKPFTLPVIQLNQHKNKLRSVSKVFDGVRRRLKEMQDLTSQKQDELRSLVGSYNSNIEDIMQEKRVAYQIKLSDRSISKLRNKLKRRLSQKLSLIKEQAEKFYEAVMAIKGRQMILPPQLIALLENIRTFIMEGKVFRMKDMDRLLQEAKLAASPEEEMVRRLLQPVIVL